MEGVLPGVTCGAELPEDPGKEEGDPDAEGEDDPEVGWAELDVIEGNVLTSVTGTGETVSVKVDVVAETVVPAATTPAICTQSDDPPFMVHWISMVRSPSSSKSAPPNACAVVEASTNVIVGVGPASASVSVEPKSNT